MRLYNKIYNSDIFLAFVCLPLLTTIAKNFKIYRPSHHGKTYDVFMTSGSFCNTSNPSCHDYHAENETCDTCSCTVHNDTFGYLNGAWRCFSAREIRQQSNCFIIDTKSYASDGLQVVTSGDNLKINLSLSSECTYQYNRDTYYRACDGEWSAAEHTGSTRYDFFIIKNSNPDRYEYWIRVQSTQGNNAFQGRIMKLHFRCKQAGLDPWDECFIFKEKFVSKPEICPMSFATAAPSMKFATTTTTTTTITENITTVSQDKSPSSRTSTIEFQTTKLSTAEMSTTKNSSNYEQKNNGAHVHKYVIIGVSAAVGAILVVMTIVICVLCCRRQQRMDITKYTSALYDSSQDQCSAGIYAEASVRLPSTSKSVTLTSHCNPSYERGRDMSIKMTDTSNQPSSPPRSSPPRMAFTNESFEHDHPVTSNASPGIRQRGNMLVKYENVTILSDVRPESVPDAERFYDNPGGHVHQYHVLENNAATVQSYGAYPSRINGNAVPNVDDSTEQTSGEFCNDVTEEPIYANSPAIEANEQRGGHFPFEGSPSEQDGNVVNLESIGYDDEDNPQNIYANTEAANIPSENCKKSVQNSSYDDDDDGDDDDDDDDDNHHKITNDEPIYDNQSMMNNKSHEGGSPLITNESRDAIYQDLKGSRAQESDYQALTDALTPVTDRKAAQKLKPKPKPRPRS